MSSNKYWYPFKKSFVIFALLGLSMACKLVTPVQKPVILADCTKSPFLDLHKALIGFRPGAIWWKSNPAHTI